MLLTLRLEGGNGAGEGAPLLNVKFFGSGLWADAGLLECRGRYMSG
jgi:hypothetical protein